MQVSVGQQRIIDGVLHTCTEHNTDRGFWTAEIHGMKIKPSILYHDSAIQDCKVVAPHHSITIRRKDTMTKIKNFTGHIRTTQDGNLTRANTYICRKCRKKTRPVNEYATNLELCVPCYDECNLENDHFDNGHETFNPKCPECRAEKKKS